MEIDSYDVLCPYCQTVCGSPEDFNEYNLFEEEPIDFECESCEKKFLCRRTVTIDYRTEADCHMNNEKHEQGKYHCKKCDIYHCKNLDVEDKENAQ